MVDGIGQGGGGRRGGSGVTNHHEDDILILSSDGEASVDAYSLANLIDE